MAMVAALIGISTIGLFALAFVILGVAMEEPNRRERWTGYLSVSLILGLGTVFFYGYLLAIAGI